MEQIPDIVLAIEEYLAKNGKGNSYLADKITEIFESDDSLLNVNGTFMSELKQSFLDMKNSADKFKKKIDSLSSNINQFANNIKQVKFPDFSNFQFPDFSSLTKSFDNFQTLVDSLEKKQQQSLTSPKEKAIGEQNVLEINIKSVSRGVIEKLANQIAKNQNIIQQDNRIINTREDEEKSGIIGSIFKFAVGALALFAGVGYLTKFLETPHGKKMKAMITEKFNDLWKAMKPHWNTLYNSTMDNVLVGIKKVKEGLIWFFKKTFNFFDLKNLLPANLQGLAVPLSKGLFYSISKITKNIGNFFTFGLFNTLSKTFDNATGFLGKHLNSIGNVVNNFITKLASNSGIVGKLAAGATKLFSGNIMKLLGKGLLKRIPIIGSFLNFKDAYDRFQKEDYIGGFLSVASGLANFVPGIGTAISIGIDLLNAFIDYKSDSSGQSKGAMIIDFLKGLRDKIWDGLKSMLGNMLEMLNPANWNFGDINDKRSLWEKIKSGTTSLFSSESPKPQPKPAAPSITPSENISRLKTTQSSTASISKSFQAPETPNQTAFSDAHKEMEKMNKQFKEFSIILQEGVAIITSATAQGSNNITEAIIATSGKKGNSAAPTVVQSGVDPIQQFRLRAQRAIEYQGR